MRLLALTVLAIGAVVPVAAQTSVALTKPDAHFDEPFTRLTSIRELPNGKVLVSDMQDKVVQLVDFAAGSMAKVGREGQGPGEYAMPATLYPMPGGETWLNDILGRRFLSIDPSGKPGKSVPLPGSSGPIAIGMGGGGADATGRIYYQAPPFNLQNPDAGPPDSLAILRWEPTRSIIDTVGWIKGPSAQVSGGGGGGNARFSVRLGTGKVFAPQEAWGVAADGAVARVLPNPYRVVWYVGGKPTPGAPVPYTPMKVTEEDKQQVIEARKKARPMMIAIGGPGGRAAPPAANSIQLPPPEFEDTKPPFTGNNSVFVAPEGEVWVLRTRPAADKTPSYDVFDRSGKLVRKVTLNPNSSLLGFGKNAVYVIRTDEDDLQYLERYRR